MTDLEVVEVEGGIGVVVLTSNSGPSAFSSSLSLSPMSSSSNLGKFTIVKEEICREYLSENQNYWRERESRSQDRVVISIYFIFRI